MCLKDLVKVKDKNKLLVKLEIEETSEKIEEKIHQNIGLCLETTSHVFPVKTRKHRHASWVWFMQEL